MKRLSLGLLCTGLTFFACGGDEGTPEPSGEDCEVGSEGCACTTGGACDDGLHCLSALCVDPGDDDGSDGSGGTDSSSGGADGTGGADSSGGADGTGGADSSGGADGSGGSNATGGADGTGGADACTPYGEDSGCEAGTWCFAGQTVEDAAVCVESGSVEEYGSCEETDDLCEPGTVCVPTTSGPQCRKVCDPNASTDAPGSCTVEGEFCSKIALQGVDAEDVIFGLCYGGCDFHGDESCEDDSLACYPGELATTGRDTCVEPPTTTFDAYAPCVGAAGSLCGPDRLCVDLGSGEVCLPLCFATEGDIDDTGHPECEYGPGTCAAVSDLPGAGLCTDMPPD